MTAFLVVGNTCGGSGKSTSAHALSVAFAEYGQRTLLVDFDGKASLTYLLGIENPRFSLMDLLTGGVQLESIVQSTSERIAFLPADSRLSHLDISDVQRAYTKFRQECQASEMAFDIVVIDSPSSVSVAHLLSLIVADFGVLPFLPNALSVRGVLQSLEISRSWEQKQDQLQWLGVLPTQASKDLGRFTENLREDFTILEPQIPRTASVDEAMGSHRSFLNEYPKNSAAIAYRELGYFLLEKMGKF